MTSQTQQIRDRLAPIDYVYLCGLLSMFPLLITEMAYLWQRPHFQFFPLAWLAFGWLLWQRGKAGAVTGLRAQLGMVTLFVALAMAAGAIILYSPWLVHIAAMLLCFSFILSRLGGTKWETGLAWCSLLVVTIPMPKNLDSLLVQRLQALSTSSASALLDFFRVPHLAEGNIISIGGGELFVDQACSGIDSLYSMAAIALLLAVWNRISFAPALCTFLLVPLWAWFGNVCRLFTISFVYHHYEIDWTHGWQHTLIGLVLFALAFLWLLQTSNAFSLLLKPFPRRSRTQLLHVMYDRLVRWPLDEKQSRKGAADSTNSTSKVRWPHIASMSVCGVLGIWACLPLAGLGPYKDSKALLPSFAASEVELVFNQSTLENAVDGLKVVDFGLTKRSRDSLFGEHSATWIVMKSGNRFTISIDFPFDGFHSLEDCYVASGQKVEGLDSDPSTGVNVVELSSTFGVNKLFFIEFQRDGELVTRPAAKAFWQRGLLDLAQPPTTYQIQIYIENYSDNTLDAELKQVLQDLFKRLLPEVQKLGSE